MTTDAELPRQFAATRSEAAFAELVRRHVNLVYSAALRQVNGDEHSAQDVTQTVFTDLARKADSLARRETLTGWLYTSAHFAAANIVRGENRRRDREEKFMREPTNENAPEADWEKLRPTLDDAMHELNEADREAILLRYFENRQFVQVGAKLGLNENAARMRVERALEKLRGIFARRGIATATALASVISANAIQIAPANLAATVTTASIATAGTGTFTLLKIMTATKLKLAFSTLVVAGAATAFVVQHQTQNKLRVENETLKQQLAQLQTDDESLSNRLTATGNSKSLSDEQLSELLKLRGEVGTLESQLTASKMQLTNVISIYMARMKQQNLEKTETDPYEKQFKVKSELGKMWVRALMAYASRNQGQLPTSIDQAADFLSAEAKTDTNFMSDSFEIVSSDTTNANPGIMVREQQPWYRSDNAPGRVYAWIRADGNQESFAFIDEGDQKSLDKWEAQNQWETDYEHQQKQLASPPPNQ